MFKYFYWFTVYMKLLERLCTSTVTNTDSLISYVQRDMASADPYLDLGRPKQDNLDPRPCGMSRDIPGDMPRDVSSKASAENEFFSTTINQSIKRHTSTDTSPVSSQLLTQSCDADDDTRRTIRAGDSMSVRREQCVRCPITSEKLVSDMANVSIDTSRFITEQTNKIDTQAYLRNSNSTYSSVLDRADVTPVTDRAYVTPVLDRANVTPSTDRAGVTPGTDRADVTPVTDPVDAMSDSDWVGTVIPDTEHVNVTPDTDSVDVTPDTESGDVMSHADLSQTGPDVDLANITQQNSIAQELITFSEDDISSIDPRLSQYLQEHFFHDDEFQFLIQSDMVRSHEPITYRCLLVVSNEYIYIMKITGPTRASFIHTWILCLLKKNLKELSSIEIGFGGQSFTLGFFREVSTYKFLIRDDRRCKMFLKPFTVLLSSLAPDGNLERISTNRSTPEEIIQEIRNSEEFESCDIRNDVTLYVMCHQRIGILEAGCGALLPISVLVTSSHIAMVTEHHHLPNIDTDESELDFSEPAKKFDVINVQYVTDITSIEVSRSRPTDLSVTYEQILTKEEYTWRLVMATEESKQNLVKVIKDMWEERFKVHMFLMESN